MSVKGIKVKIDDRAFKNILKRIRKMPAKHVRVGVLQGSGNVKDSNFTIVQLAATMEFGRKDGSIPARSFIGATFSDNTNITKVKKATKTIAKAIVEDKKSLRQGLTELGFAAEAWIREFIRNKKVTPDISKATKEKKKSDTPLIDTGQLIAAITHEVKDGNAE